MKTVKIFIASSIVEFEQERDKLTARLRGLNDKYRHNVYFQVDVCEDYSHAETPRPKQEEFNALVRQCDFFFALIGADVGKATLKEIDVAREQLKKSGSVPKIVVFFKDVENPSAGVKQLKDTTCNIMGQYPPKFTHISEVTKGILWELIDAGAFSDLDALERGRRTQKELVTRIRENWRKIAALGEPTEDNALELALLYRENVELSRAAGTEWGTFEAYARFLHKRGQDVKAIETGAELDALYMPDDDPDDRATLKQLLGDCHAALGRCEDAETYYRAALDIYRELAKKESEYFAPDLWETCVKLAGILFLTYRFEAAERLYKEALTGYLCNSHEYTLEIAKICHALLGLAKNAPNLETAILQEGEQAFSNRWFSGYSADETSANLDTTQSWLSGFLEAFPNSATAEKLVEQAEAKARELTKNTPDNYERALVEICSDMADWLSKHNQMESAEVLARKALQVHQKLGNDIPALYNKLALVLSQTKRPYEAEIYYRQAIDIIQRLDEQVSSVYEPDLVCSYHNLANLLRDIERYEEAEQYYKKSLEIYKKLAQRDPDIYDPDLAKLYYDYGLLLQKSGQDPISAKAYFQDAIAIWEKYADCQEQLNLAVSAWNECLTTMYG